MGASSAEVFNTVSIIGNAVGRGAGEMAVMSEDGGRGGRGGGGASPPVAAASTAFGLPMDALHLIGYAAALGVVYLALSRR